MTAPVADRGERRRRGRGAERWSDWWLISTFGFWTALAVVDRDWYRALTPTIFFVGLSVQLLLKKVRRPDAGTRVFVASVACVFVVSVVREAWVMAVATGIGLILLAGIWVLHLWFEKSARSDDDV